MMFSSVSLVLAVLCHALFVTPTTAKLGSTNIPQTADPIQARFHKNGCLPGPLRLDSISSCAMFGQAQDAVPPAPWTQQPYCVNGGSYCVFSKADFLGPDRGLSIIDLNPESGGNATSAIATLARLLSSNAPALGSVRSGSPPYEVRDIVGKGKGLVAIRKIPRGEVFMVDYPAVVADVHFPRRVRQEEGRQLLREAIARLPAAEEILSLARSSVNPDTVPVVEDVMKTNSFGVEIAGNDYMALFPNIAVRDG